MAEQYPGATMAAMHATAAGLAGTGLLGKQTMRRFADPCLPPVPSFSAAEDPGLAGGGVRLVA